MEKFEKISELVEDVITETKLMHSEYFSARAENKVFSRPENMQYTGAYKVGGTYYKIHILIEEKRSKGLITASAGNRTQGVAYAAKLADVKTAAVIPTTTSLIKVSRIENYGADVVLEGNVFNGACDYAYKLAGEFGYIFVHPFDDLDVATGQGTVVTEIIKGPPTVDYILVPIGGGGPYADTSALAKLLNPRIRVVGMEPTGASCTQTSLKEGKVVELPQVSTIADGMTVKCPSEKLSPYVQENVGDIIVVGDSELIVAFLDMVENHRMIVESSGLPTVVTLGHLNVQKKKTIPISGGGGVDIITMSSITRHGLIERDRVFTMSVFPPDGPGKLTKVFALLAREQGSIIRLKRNQFIGINCNAVVELCVTTKVFGTDHRNQIVSALISTEYRPKPVKPKGTYNEM